MASVVGSRPGPRRAALGTVEAGSRTGGGSPVRGLSRRWPVVRWLLALALVLAAGVFLRVHDHAVWQEQRHLYFFDGEPLLLNADGYHYLRLARDLERGDYHPVDELRTTPEHPLRPHPPPLLPVLTAALSPSGETSLAWTALVLPVVLSLGLAAPVLVLCRQLRIPALPALVAALAAITSRTYLVRTSLGAYDTDCLVVFFSLWASVLALGFGLSRGRRRLAYLLGAALNAACFAWWWDQAPEAVALICLAPLVLAAALWWRPGRREGWIAGGVAAAGLAAGLTAAGQAVEDALGGIRDVLVHGVKGTAAGFPDVRDDIGELHGLGWDQLVEGTTVFAPVLLLGVAGLAWLAWTHPRRAAVGLTVPLVLAASVFLFGYRAMIFWGPVVGVGLAFLTAAVGRRLGPDRSWLPAGAAAGSAPSASGRPAPHRRWLPAAGRRLGASRPGLPAAAAGSAPSASGRSAPSRPWLPAAVVAGAAALVVVPNAAFELSEPTAAPRVTYVMPAVASIRERTPPDAVIWTTWTAGYPLMYFTGRRVIADGEFMSGERRVYGNLPLASPDSGLARSFMRFYVAHGMAGVHRLHALAGSAGAGLRWMRRHLAGPPEAAARALAALAAASGDPVCASVEACRAFLFPARTAPVFVLLNHEMMAGKWFRYGTWDAGGGRGEASAALLLFGIRRTGDTLVLRDGLAMDVNEGKRLSLDADGREFRQPVGKLVTYTGSALEEKDYGDPEGFHVEWMPHNGFGAIMTRNVAESLFNQLFIRHTSNPRHFRHAEVRAPAFSLWEVTPGS